ncbi:hypothetical protein FQN50_005255 [Emmonsiellopsis sp. PD_5]|nr:hypothetical protein FQN50_005255 [Emmonsiellopsis sp. PD_5]
MEGGKLTAQSLASVPKFNWQASITPLTLFFLFYFNRLFATLVSYPIRAYTWHYYRVYIDIHAIQISLLGGRIFFKGFRYHGENETISVQSGYLTWRYWLRSVRKVDLSRNEQHTTGRTTQIGGSLDGEDNTRSASPSVGERGGISEANRLPCRLEVTLHGVEWFVYNRSAAYDSILAGFGYGPDKQPDGDEHGPDDHFEEGDNEKADPRKSTQKGSGSSSSRDFSRFATAVDTSSSPPQRRGTATTNISNYNSTTRGTSVSSSTDSSADDSTNEGPTSKLLALLPVQLVCHRGAMVMGNENTKTVLTTKFDKALGQIDASSAGPLDLFRQIFEFDIYHPVVQMRPNPDFKQSQLAAAKGLSAANEEDETEQQQQKHDFHWRYRRRKQKIWHSVRDLIPYFQRSVESFHIGVGNDRAAVLDTSARTGLPGEARWLGLTRYLDDDDQDEHEGWSSIEYGRFSTLVDCPSIHFNYYWDIPGRVSMDRTGSRLSVVRVSDDINGTDPPEWGLHLTVRGGAINYGPWADRERVGIQSIFFPNFYRDSQPSPPLAPQRLRQSTQFKLTIDIERETTIRIPTREASKDWLWKGRVDAVCGISKLKSQKEKKHPRNTDAEKSTHGPDIRPFGWLALRIDANSTVRYSMDMVASSAGYHNQLDLDLRGSRMTSSVNHGLLWKSGPQTISCDLSNPLQWNTLHTWTVGIDSQDLELFLLRDHIFLLTDLVGDWTSGPPSDFYTFVPFHYNIDFSFTHVQLFMNVNDSNIINNPSDLNDNAFLIIKGETLTSHVDIPVEKYIPTRNTVSFDLNLSNGSIDLLTPLWNTQRLFLPETSVATLKNMKLLGNYNYNLGTSSTLTDTLEVDIVGVSPKLYLYGFLIRYFLKIKENYFGEYMHFKTLEEFQGLLAKPQTPEESSGLNPSPKTNDLDVFIQVHADHASVLIPTNIYDRSNCLRINAISLDADVRFTNYYMDLETSFSPLEMVTVSTSSDGSHVSSHPQLFVDGLSIYGHRLFGLPPTEPTYVCNWDFRVGQIGGECSPTFLKLATSAVRFVGFSFDDEENALPPIHPIVLHDVTFLRAKINSIKLWVLVDEAALLLSSGILDIDFNDWAGSSFSERLNVILPDLVLAAVDRKAATRLRDPSHQTVPTYAYFQTSLAFRMVERKTDFLATRAFQQEHIRIHDKRSNRTPWLLHNDENRPPSSIIDLGHAKLNPPAMVIPPMPEPIQTIGRLYPDSSISSSSSFRYTSDEQSSILSSRSSNSNPRNPRNNDQTRRTASVTLRSEASEPVFYDTSTTYWRNTETRIPSGSRASQSLRSRERPRENTVITPTKPLSSAWVTPHFHFSAIKPDTGDVPDLSPANDAQEQDEWDSGEVYINPGPEYENATHTFFLVESQRGLRGFFSPDALYAISSLLDEFQPIHPVDVIDNLQASVISDILAHEKAMAKPKKITNFSIRVSRSHVRAVHSSASTDERALGRFRDQYDIKLSRTQATFRSTVENRREDQTQPKQLGATMHVSADSIFLSAQGEKLDAFDRKGLLHCELADTIFWSVSQQSHRSRLQIQNIETVTSSKSVEDLAFLIDRTTRLVNSVMTPFEEVSASRTRRLRSLVYSLTNYGSQTPDPLFLTRTSYVLRAAGEHLRLNDSWKIISRLRNIYKSLPEDQVANLTADCLANSIPYPSDARATVLSSFDQWRTWDLAHVKKSSVMKAIWGEVDDDQLKSSQSVPQGMSLNLNRIRFCLDPGPKENELLIQDLTSSINVNMGPRSASPGTETPIRSIIVQTYCSDLSVGLKWEICELIEGILKNIPKTTKQTSVLSQSLPKPKISEEFQFVFVANNGSVVLDGINVNIALLGSGIKCSVIHQPPSKDSLSSTSVIVSSDETSARFTSRSKELMIWRLWNPNVFLSHSSQISKSRVKHDWRSAAACKMLRYEMNEDPLGLVQVADRIVEDEVKYILDLISGLELPPAQQPMQPSTKKNVIHRLRVATFLDDYQIRFVLLPSLTYVISGEVARLSIAPAKGSKLVVDFDIKNNSHKFWTGNDKETSIISALDIPPINGRIMVATSPNRTFLDIDSTIELTKVDAGAIRNLLGAVNGPEISHLLSDLDHDVRILKRHLNHVIPSGAKSPMAKPDEQTHDLVYRVRFTLAGIGVFATAPGLSSKDYSADMEFKFGMVQAHLENAAPSGPVLDYPEFQIHLSQISFDLKKRDKVGTYPYGSLVLDAQIFGTSKVNDSGDVVRYYHLVNKGLEIELFAETASMIVDIAAHLQERLKTLDLSHEISQLRKLRLLTSPERKRNTKVPVIETSDQPNTKNLFNAMYSVELAEIQVSWIISAPGSPHSGAHSRQAEDLVFSIRKIELSTKKENAARLRIADMQFQMVPLQADKRNRSQNSALLPEIVFNVAYVSNGSERRLAFQAAGKSLDIRMTSEFILPASILQDSIALASEKLRLANSLWSAAIPPEKRPKNPSPGIVRLASLLVDADFAGAVVSLQGRQDDGTSVLSPATRHNRASGGGKYGQYIQQDSTTTATLRAPGVALKVQFEDTGSEEPTLNAEMKVDASTNVLHPTVVPLITQISDSVKEVVGDSDGDQSQAVQKAAQEKAIGKNDPTTILGRCKLNVGLWICRQEFTLSCQPIARVLATACFEDSYITVNTVQSSEQRRFFAMSLAFNALQASVKHVYSSESTASFTVDSVVMSLMNSKHVSSSSGISAILKVSPMKVQVNAKQVQDFLLFREIWLPPDESPNKPAASQQSTHDSQAYIVQRYQQMAATGSFPWNSVIAIMQLDIQLDLGQTLGKSEFTIKNLWLSSKKSSDWEQNLCIGFETVAIESKGRLSGIIGLHDFKVWTSIRWPDNDQTYQTPLVQASIGFNELQAKVSFEYQPFLVVDVTSFDFMMYNVRNASVTQKDHLVSVLDGDRFQVFCTALTASQALALYQTIQKLAQDKQSAYEASLKEIEKFLLRRKSTLHIGEALQIGAEPATQDDDSNPKMPISLHTDVVVNLKAINIGAFPSTFDDNQIFKLVALDAVARFSVAAEDSRIHSGLGLTLGQLRVALSGVSRPTVPPPEELSVREIVRRADDSRGGTILKVPRVVASMQTWQTPMSNHIEYIFKSSFEGKVDVGWNYSRISFIRSMWTNHSNALASRLGKPLPQPAVQITREREGEEGEDNGQGKITAVVNVPQSKYTYTAMEPPVIETPQLRDMGEATPPLEWIGLHRDKLPNITHQIIIVTLMEIAKDVEDAYTKILGSS